MLVAVGTYGDSPSSNKKQSNEASNSIDDRRLTLNAQSHPLRHAGELSSANAGGGGVFFLSLLGQTDAGSMVGQRHSVFGRVRRRKHGLRVAA